MNLELYDTAGVGFTVNTVRYTMAYPSGLVLLDNTEIVAEHVAARGRTVLQFASPAYPSFTGQASVSFVADITDDKGNAMTVSNSATVLDRQSDPVRLD